MRKLKTQRKQDTYPKFSTGRASVQSQMPTVDTETGGKGQGTNFTRVTQPKDTT